LRSFSRAASEDKGILLLRLLLRVCGQLPFSRGAAGMPLEQSRRKRFSSISSAEIREREFRFYFPFDQTNISSLSALFDLAGV
jgi:hypothetical protein